jgi:hypothetical protein
MNRADGLVSNTAMYWSESAGSFILAFTANAGGAGGGNQYSNIAASSYANLALNTVNSTAVYVQNGIFWANGVAWSSGSGGGSSVSYYTGSAPPTSGNTVGSQWFDTVTGALFEYEFDGTNYQWVDVSTPVLITSNAVVAFTDNLVANTITADTNGTITVSGNINASGNITSTGFYWANGISILTGISAGGSTYSNANVAAYLVANPDSGTYSNSNVASYLTLNPQSGTYSNSNVASYLTLNPQSGTYSNSNVASYLTLNVPVGTYSNANVSSYLSSGNATIPLQTTVGNGGSTLTFATSGGNGVLDIGGVQTATFSQTSIAVTGGISATSNISAGNISTTGVVSTVNITATGNASLGNIANITITGGANNQFLTTNGNGKVSFTDILHPFLFGM